MKLGDFVTSKSWEETDMYIRAPRQHRGILLYVGEELCIVACEDGKSRYCRNENLKKARKEPDITLEELMFHRVERIRKYAKAIVETKLGD